jgi:hypothetical protein
MDVQVQPHLKEYSLSMMLCGDSKLAALVINFESTASLLNSKAKARWLTLLSGSGIGYRLGPTGD